MIKEKIKETENIIVTGLAYKNNMVIHRPSKAMQRRLNPRDEHLGNPLVVGSLNLF